MTNKTKQTKDKFSKELNEAKLQYEDMAQRIAFLEGVEWYCNRQIEGVGDE